MVSILPPRYRVPLWSTVLFIVPVVLVFLFRRVWRKTDSYYSILNECICTLLWLVWCFEIHAVTLYSNPVIHSLTLFLALLAQPLIYGGALTNPCVVIINYLRNKITGQQALSLFIAELIAVPLSMGTVVLTWNALSELSPAHYDASLRAHDFLQVNFILGMLSEAAVTFIAYIPQVYVKHGPLQNVICATTFIGLELLFGAFSGAFFNPLPITTFSIYYGKHTWAELLVAYWGGSMLGGILVWRTLYSTRR